MPWPGGCLWVERPDQVCDVACGGRASAGTCRWAEEGISPVVGGRSRGRGRTCPRGVEREKARTEEGHEIVSGLTPSALAAAAADERAVRYPFSSDSRWLACVSDVEQFTPTTRPASDHTPHARGPLTRVRRSKQQAASRADRHS
jgi:hypothetical protein